MNRALPTITNSMAARILGVPAQSLRRWVREGKFLSIGEVPWDKGPTFRRQRVYERDWLEKVALELGVQPDWTVLDGTQGPETANG
jgi:hypothetical protein